MENKNKTFTIGCLAAMATLALTARPAMAQQPAQATAHKEKADSGFIKKDAIVSHGFLSSYQQDGKHYLAIPDSIFGRDILVTITITKGAYRKQRQDDEHFGYAGDSMFSKMIRFVKTGDTVSLVYPDVVYTGNGTENL